MGIVNSSLGGDITQVICGKKSEKIYIKVNDLISETVYWGARYTEGHGIMRGTVYWGARYTEGHGIMRGTVYWGARYYEGHGILSGTQTELKKSNI